MNLDIFWEATTCMPYAIKKVEKLKVRGESKQYVSFRYGINAW